MIVKPQKETADAISEHDRVHSFKSCALRETLRNQAKLSESTMAEFWETDWGLLITKQTLSQNKKKIKWKKIFAMFSTLQARCSGWHRDGKWPCKVLKEPQQKPICRL